MSYGRAGLSLVTIAIILINLNKINAQFDYGYGYGYGISYPFGRFGQSYGERETNAVSNGPIYDPPRSYLTTTTRIIGGRPADIDSFSYTCAIIHNMEFICGGTLIAPDLIITSAHCVYKKRTKLFKIRCGSNSFKTGGIVSNVKKIIMHGDFNKYTYDNDIAIMKLSRPIKGPNINYPKLSSSNLIPSYGTVAGWGAVDTDNRDPSFYLQAVEVGVTDCRLFHRNLMISNNMICAGLYGGGRDFCDLDDGAGLFKDKTLFAIATKTYCGAPALPSIYTFVPKYRNWINEVIENAFYD